MQTHRLERTQTEEMTNRPKPDIAFAVTVLRQARGMSKRDLGNVIQMPRQWVHKIETGASDPKIDSVVKLAKGLKVSTRTLVAISEVRRAA